MPVVSQTEWAQRSGAEASDILALQVRQCLVDEAKALGFDTKAFELAKKERKKSVPNTAAATRKNRQDAYVAEARKLFRALAGSKAKTVAKDLQAAAANNKDTSKARVRKKPDTKQVSSPSAGSSRGFSSVPSGSGLARDLKNPTTQISEEVQTHPVYPVLLYKGLLQSRLRRIAEEWIMTDTKDDFDAVLLVTGVVDDEEEVDKTIAMQYWLFGSKAPRQ